MDRFRQKLTCQLRESSMTPLCIPSWSGPKRVKLCCCSWMHPILLWAVTFWATSIAERANSSKHGLDADAITSLAQLIFSQKRFIRLRMTVTSPPLRFVRCFRNSMSNTQEKRSILCSTMPDIKNARLYKNWHPAWVFTWNICRHIAPT